MSAEWLMALIQGTTAVPRGVGKLLDTLADQIGLYLEPAHIRQIASAEGDAMITMAKAQGEVAKIQLKKTWNWKS